MTQLTRRWFALTLLAIQTYRHASGLVKQHSFRYSRDDCKLIATFSEESLIVSKDNLMCGGLNVSFDGLYKKVNKDH